jgi:RNA polymerase sigma-70 factor (ECF subfamily)
MPHSHSYRTDEEILEGLRKDAPGAFEAFFDRYAERIYGFGLKVCGHSEDARDVVQDTLLSALRSLKEIKHARALPRWLYRVASNACLMKRRAGDYAENREIPLEELMPPRKDGKPLPLQDWSLDPDEEARRSEEKRLLREAIGELPPPYRLVLVLRDMEEMSNQEVADVLHVPVSTVKMRLHRARLFLRKELTRRLGKDHPADTRKAS